MVLPARSVPGAPGGAKVGTPADAPRLSLAGAQTVARERFGLVGRASRLPSERDQNFKLDCASGGAYVLKVFHRDEDPEFVEAQARVFHLLLEVPRRVFPTLVPTVEGDPYAQVTVSPTTGTATGPDGQRHIVWVTRFMPGAPAALADAPSLDALRDLGGVLGQMDAVLARNPQPAARRRLVWSAQSAPAVIRKHVHLLADPSRRALAMSTLAGFDAHARPRLAGLRHSLVHNDVNDHNLLLEEGRVSAVLDFGDMLESYTACEPAHAAAYLMLDHPDPLAVAVAVVGGYHAAYPLREAELHVLYELIRLRLTLSVVLSAHQQTLRPDDPYLSVSEAPAWRLLERLASEDPPRHEFVEAMLAVGGEG